MPIVQPTVSTTRSWEQGAYLDMCEYHEITEHRKIRVFLNGTLWAAAAENPGFKDTDVNIW